LKIPDGNLEEKIENNLLRVSYKTENKKSRTTTRDLEAINVLFAEQNDIK